MLQGEAALAHTEERRARPRVGEGSERKAHVSSGHIALPARTGDDARSVLPAGKVTRAVAPDLRGAFLTQARSTEPSIAHTANLHLQHPPRRWPEGPLRITSLAQTTGCGPKGPPEMATTLCPSRNEKALKVTSQELQSEADLPLGQNTHHVRSWGKGQPTHQSPGHTWSTLWGRGASFLLPPASSGWSSIRLA